MKYATINPVARYGTRGKPSFLFLLMFISIASTNPKVRPITLFFKPSTNELAIQNFISAPPILPFPMKMLNIISKEITKADSNMLGIADNSKPTNATMTIITWSQSSHSLDLISLKDAKRRIKLPINIEIHILYNLCFYQRWNR